MKKVLLVDLDDTLIKTQEGYDKIMNQVIDYIHEKTEQGKEKKEIRELFQKVNLKNLGKYAACERFIRTSIEVYKKLTGVKEIDKNVETIIQLSNAVFYDVFEVQEGALAFLENMRKKGYKIVVVATGEKEIQEKRMLDAKLYDYVDATYIVKFEKKEIIGKMMKVHGKENVILVGNSEKMDIVPSLALGIKAIQIKRETWENDAEKIDKKDKNYKYAENFEEVVSCVREFEEKIVLEMN